MEKEQQSIRRIGIDARFYGPMQKGLGRYTQEVVDNVLKIDKENEYVIFLGLHNFNEFKTGNKKAKKVLVKARWYSLSEQIMMPYLIWKEKLDFIHFPHFNVPVVCPVKFIVTIHDLILTKFPTQRASTLNSFLYKVKTWGYNFVLSQAVKKSEKILTVSEFVKNDIIKNFDIDKDKVIVAYLGVANSLLKGEEFNDKNEILKYNIHKPYLIYVGNAYPHKNLEGLIDVFDKVSEDNKNLSLVLVGKEDYFYKRVKEYAQKVKNGGKIVFPGFVEDSNLINLYKDALAYVFPSYYEGFGIPPLEAMVQKCPVVSSNKSSMPEILGEAATYFNPENKEDMYKKILEIVSDNDLREALKVRGVKQAKKYSWDVCVNKTLKIYREII